MYADNLKAGSTSMRALLKTVSTSRYMRLGTDKAGKRPSPDLASPPALPGWANGSNTPCVQRGSTSGWCVRASAARNAFDFRFTIARDPAEKFESGVLQAWLVNNPRLKELYPTADAMLDAQLAAYAAKRSRDTGEAFASIDPLGAGLSHGVDEAEAHAILNCSESRCVISLPRAGARDHCAQCATSKDQPHRARRINAIAGATVHWALTRNMAGLCRCRGERADAACRPLARVGWGAPPSLQFKVPHARR